MAYVGGGVGGVGILVDRGSPFQAQLGGTSLGAYTEAQIDAVLRSYPNTAIRIENGMNIVDLVHIDRGSGQPVLIGTMDDPAAARARFDYLEAHKNDTKLPAGTPVEGSSDPRTREQNAWLMANAVEGTSMPRPEFRGGLLTPRGQFTRDYSLIGVPEARRTEINAVIQAGSDINKPSGGYVLALNADGVPVSYVGVFPTGEVIAKFAAMGQDVSQYSAGMTQGWIANLATIAKANPTQTATVPVPTAPIVTTTPATPVYVPPATTPEVERVVTEATDQGGNIPASGGATGGGYRPSSGSGGTETSVPVSGRAPVLNAAPSEGMTPDQTKMALIGAGVLAFFLLRRKGS